MKSRRIGVVLATGVAALYRARLRRPVLTWGAIEAEAASRLPGDELLQGANGVSTRAIDIRVPAADVWPWLAQLGPSPRGGAYTYAWIENMLGLNMHSVDRVLPESQRPQIGETIDFGRWQLGLDVRARRARRAYETDQSQSVPPANARRAHRHAANGARLACDGTEDAERDQATRRAARLDIDRLSVAIGDLPRG
jgi:hypothetical protein